MKITTSHRALFQEIMSKINSKKYEYHIENGKVRLYIRYYVGRDIVMYYYKKSNQMWLSDGEIWSKFTSKFGLNYYQVMEITSAMMEEYTKINGVTTLKLG